MLLSVKDVLVGRAEAFRREADARMRTFRGEVAALSREIDALNKVCDSLRNDAIARDRERARLDHDVKEVMSYLVRPMPAAAGNVVCLSVGSVLGTLSRDYDVWKPELTGTAQQMIDSNSHDHQ
jgi:hypothetical protein